MDLTEIGKNIKSMREEANFSKAKIAEYLSVDEDMVVKIENGEIDIDLDIIQKLSNLYGCRLDQVLFGRNPKERIIDISNLDELSLEEMISLAAVTKIALNQFDMDEFLKKERIKIMIKYLLEENLIVLDGFGIEPGYDHCITS